MDRAITSIKRRTIHARECHHARHSACIAATKAVVLYRNASMRYGHLNLFQTEADIAQMESLQRDQAAMEGQDPTEQRHLEMLAHAV